MGSVQIPIDKFGISTLNMNYFVYIVRCSGNSLYTGITWNLEQRISEHNTSKRGAKSIRGKLPVILVYFESLETKSLALRREKEIKGWRKKKKENLVLSPKNEISM